MFRFGPLFLSLATALGAVTVATLPAQAAGPGYVADPASLVDPIIGTSGYVDDFPGADVPFGMVQWSPDTPSRPAGGGYEYKDSSITGYSLTHISGPGCGAFGDIPILPTSGAIGADPGKTTANFSHSDETAQAGYYSVTAGGVRTDLTATTRSGMGRFTFPDSSGSNLLIKLSGSQAGVDATHVQVINDHEIAGFVTSGHFCGANDHYTVSFDMAFDAPIVGSGTWHDAKVKAGSTELSDAPAAPLPVPATVQEKALRRDQSGRHVAPHYHGTRSTPKISPPVGNADGAYVTFDAKTVQAKVGISFVGIDNARANRQKENPGWSFDKIHNAAHSLWTNKLNQIQIAGGDERTQRIFYTALYHALLHPNVFSDVNGQYMGFDNQVHKVSGKHLQYANYSGWDIYRTQAQLAAVVAPQETSDSVRSMLNDYDQSGQLPKWSLANGESYVMVGDPADEIIADAYAFGARDFDTQHALDAMLAEANNPNRVRPGLSYYETRGYLPMDGKYGCCNFYGPVSTQQEYNSADYAVSRFAAAVGDTENATRLADRAQNWQNVFNPGSGYLVPKYLDGTWQPGFAPTNSDGFVEGNSAQYTPMEPFDLKGLIAAGGGNAAWVKRLDGLTANIAHPMPANADLSNEPSFEIPWEYDYAGAPYKTQGVVRAVQQAIYTDAPAGMLGNDDLGTMSGWYVWSALGMYPETPGTNDLALGSPLFPKAAVHLPSGKTLTITGTGAALTAPYVQSMTVNGAAWNHAYLDPKLFTTGGSVVEKLGTSPNTSWATKAADAPPSYTGNLLPGLAYTDPGEQLIVAPGKTTTVKVGVSSMSGSTQSMSWRASTTSGGPSVSPTSGTLSVPAGAKRSQTLTLTAPTKEGSYLLTFTVRSATGVALPKAVVRVDVAKPGELWPYYNNRGVCQDGVAGLGNFDGDGWCYSAEQLAAGGVTQGADLTVNKLHYTWPDVAPAQPNNIVAAGQTIPLIAPAGATRFGVLGSATNANPGAQGDVTVTYTDGATSTLHLGLSDWTLGANAFPPAFGNTEAAKTPYRDTSGGDKQVIATYLFGADGALSPGKTVASVHLPATVDSGQFHVFAFGYDVAPTQ